MKAVVQRVRHARVTVEGAVIAEIDLGVVILLGVGIEDLPLERAEACSRYLADKIADLRIFEDAAGKLNLSLVEVGGAALVVSQFTLYADMRKGRRPSFTDAAPGGAARPIVDHFASLLAARGIPTQAGQFGAHMLVEIENDGPVTIILEKNSFAGKEAGG
jgi:D-tyrosyl-tRNA(Tyr) deacylase